MGNILFQNALKNQNMDRPPIWFMRQAGRYHSHYQELKKVHTFEQLCKNPSLAHFALISKFTHLPLKGENLSSRCTV